VLGYAFFMNSLEVYDRSGNVVAIRQNEEWLETPFLDPTDFLAAGIANVAVKKIGGYVARETGEELSYSHDLFGRCPKYRILLAYSVSPVPSGAIFRYYVSIAYDKLGN
jgi:hypothetical protein